MRDQNVSTKQLRRPAFIECGWCRRSVPVGQSGRVPKWCSTTCRHRAWEQRRAAASGLAAVEIVERPVEVEAQRVVHRVEHVEVQIHPRGADWAITLTEIRRAAAQRPHQRPRPTALIGPFDEALSAMSGRVARRR